MYFRFVLLLLLLQSSWSTASTKITRGPYLQAISHSSVRIKWSTSDSVNSVILFGYNPNQLKFKVTDSFKTKSHSLILNGLKRGTKYYYSVGYDSTTLEGDSNNFFITYDSSNLLKQRFWITGDCGTGNQVQSKVRDAFIKYNSGVHCDGWLLLGDNAYSYGLEDEYQRKFFEPYQDSSIMKETFIWPTPGNHDYGNDSNKASSRSHAYFNIFQTPQNGEMGGIPSKHPSFYSYNIGNIHFISLDSYGKESDSSRMFDTLGEQILWLKKDLIANQQLWTIVYFHHPPYTMGSHNSDTETELIKIRENVVKILERYQVDLVLTGHSHCYERSKLMKGNYGLENTFDYIKNNLSNASGLYNGGGNSCAYVKTEGHNNGTIYIVAGSSGQYTIKQTTWPHDAMYYSDVDRGGSVILDIDSNKLDLKFLGDDGIIHDNFTMFKNVGHNYHYKIDENNVLIMNASWKGDYIWDGNGKSSRTLTEVITKDTQFIVHDKFQCLTDTFTVTVNPCIKPNYTYDVSSRVCLGEKGFLNFHTLDLSRYRVSLDSGIFSSDSEISFTPFKSSIHHVKISDSVMPSCTEDTFSFYTIVDLHHSLKIKTDKKNDSFCVKDTIKVNCTSGFKEYRYYINDTLLTTTSDSVFIYTEASGDLIITVIAIRDSNVCLEKDSIKLFVSHVMKPGIKKTILGNRLTLSDTSQNNLIYSWSVSDTIISSQKSFTHLLTKSGTYKIKLIVSNSSGCTMEYQDSIKFQTSASRTEQFKESESILFNSATRLLTIHHSKRTGASCSINIFSTQGVFLKQTIIPTISNSEEFGLQLDELPIGVYLIVVQNENSFSRFKIIII